MEVSHNRLIVTILDIDNEDSYPKESSQNYEDAITSQIKTIIDQEEKELPVHKLTQIINEYELEKEKSFTSMRPKQEMSKLEQSNAKILGLNFLYKELLKQITQQHKDQGLLMDKIWNAYHTEFESITIDLLIKNMVKTLS